MVDPTVERSPQLFARTAGLLYLYIIVAGTFAEVFVRGRFVIARDAGASAKNIVDHEWLFRIAASAELLHLASDVIVTVILYLLLRMVNQPFALLTVFFRFACIVILGAAAVLQFAALRLLRGSEYLAALAIDEREALAVLAMQVHSDAYTVSLMFFGFGCLTLGYLILKSEFFPRPLGVLMLLAGVCYLFNTLAQLLRLGIASQLFPGLFIPIFIAELALSIWLLVRGVRISEFRRVTGSAATALS